jgi:hypothetical protein
VSAPEPSLLEATTTPSHAVADPLIGTLSLPSPTDCGCAPSRA